jgi:nicotinate phosphoribosyltransferase
MPADAAAEDLLRPIFERGRSVYTIPTLEESRNRLQKQFQLFHAGVKRFVNPHRYPVGLDLGLHERKTALILKTRGFEGRRPGS